jgi:hypothetical protein
MQCNIDNKLKVKVRVSVDSFTEYKEFDDVYYHDCLVRAITEYNLEKKWRERLIKSGGELLSKEWCNNMMNLQKWLCQMKIG